MSALGDVGVGNLTKVMIKQEPSFAGAIASATEIWPRKSRVFFQRVPHIIDSNYANANELGYGSEAFHTTAGILGFEVDMTTIGWFLNMIMGNKVTAQQGGTSEYLHTFKFGSTLKSYKVFMDKGGLSSALNINYLGQALDRLAINVGMFDKIQAEAVFIGQTDESGSGPGTESYALDNLTVPFGSVKFYTGAVGTTTVAGMTQWTPPKSMRFEVARNRQADNFISDNTGKTSGITDGKPTATCGLMTVFNTDHEYANFRASTHRSFACRLDTGLAIPSGNGSNYMLDIVCPRVAFEAYNLNIEGEGAVYAAVTPHIMKDPTATYSVRFDLYNATTAYADAT